MVNVTDGTFSQSSRLELDSGKMRLGRGGDITCVAKHAGGTRRATATLSVIGVSAPSIEDSMAMVAVALLLYGMIKFLYWTFSSSEGEVNLDLEGILKLNSGQRNCSCK
ncbi:unnamed protein product [Leuciscus chuanchicus]